MTHTDLKPLEGILILRGIAQVLTLERTDPRQSSGAR